MPKKESGSYLVHKSCSVQESYYYCYLGITFSASRFCSVAFPWREKVKAEAEDAELKIVMTANL